jgi:hypothetical protein
VNLSKLAEELDAIVTLSSHIRMEKLLADLEAIKQIVDGMCDPDLLHRIQCVCHRFHYLNDQLKKYKRWADMTYPDAGVEMEILLEDL